jgi:chromosomal replication initiation ATPase DnaA
MAALDRDSLIVRLSVEAICEELGVEVEQISSKTRLSEVSRARHVVAAFLRGVLSLKRSEIAEILNRDIQTVDYLVRTFKTSYSTMHMLAFQAACLALEALVLKHEEEEGQA